MRSGLACRSIFEGLCDKDGAAVIDDVWVSVTFRALAIVEKQLRLRPEDRPINFVACCQPHVVAIGKWCFLPKGGPTIVVVKCHEQLPIRLALW